MLEAARRIDYTGSEARLFYWRTAQGAEVDLLVERHGRLVLAAEIKAKHRVVRADLSGLRSFGQAHPGVPRVMVSLVAEEHRLEGVSVLPFHRVLGRLEKWIR